MKSPGNVFAVALMQILLIVLLFPLLIMLFIFSLIWRKFDWKSIWKWIQSLNPEPSKNEPKKPEKAAGSNHTYDVEFEPKK